MRKLRHERRGIPLTPSTHRLRRGLPGYLILFAPHAFAPQRQLLPRDPPSPPVFLLISAHFTATPGIPVSPATLKSARIDCRPGAELRGFTADATNPARALSARQITPPPKPPASAGSPGVELRVFTADATNRLRALYAQ